MPLPGVVENLDGLEEPVRKFYTKVEDGDLAGKYVLDADVSGHPKVAVARAESVKERKARQELEARYKDIDPEEFRRLKQAAEDAAKGGTEKPDVEKLIAKRVAETEAKFAKDLEERDTLRGELRRLKLDDQVKAAALKAGMLAEDVDDEMDILLRGRTKRFELDDKGKVVVLDDDGDPTGMSPEKWFAETYRTKKPKVFAAHGGGGSGTRTSTGAGGTAGVLKLSREDARDPRKYQAAREQAQRQGLRLEIEPAA